MKKFSTNWKSSTKPRKQRKYRFKAPLHLKQKMIGAHLSKELRKKHRMRSISVVKGDKVKIMRGSFKKREGKVEKIDIKSFEVYVNGIEFQKKDGTKIQVALHPSNLMIMEFNLDDKLRQKILEVKNEKSS